MTNSCNPNDVISQQHNLSSLFPSLNASSHHGAGSQLYHERYVGQQPCRQHQPQQQQVHNGTKTISRTNFFHSSNRVLPAFSQHNGDQGRLSRHSQRGQEQPSARNRNLTREFGRTDISTSQHSSHQSQTAIAGKYPKHQLRLSELERRHNSQYGSNGAPRPTSRGPSINASFIDDGRTTSTTRRRRSSNERVVSFGSVGCVSSSPPDERGSFRQNPRQHERHEEQRKNSAHQHQPRRPNRSKPLQNTSHSARRCNEERHIGSQRRIKEDIGSADHSSNGSTLNEESRSRSSDGTPRRQRTIPKDVPINLQFTPSKRSEPPRKPMLHRSSSVTTFRGADYYHAETRPVARQYKSTPNLVRFESEVLPQHYNSKAQRRLRLSKAASDNMKWTI